MKKLIEELEKQAKDIPSWYSEYSEQWIFDKGIEYAINIVRAHNPWHETTKDGLPEPDKLLWFLCRDGSVFLGCYESFTEDGEICYCWSVRDGAIYREGNEIIVQTVFDDDYDVTHYRYIPTDLPEVKP